MDIERDMIKQLIWIEDKRTSFSWSIDACETEVTELEEVTE